MSELKYNLICPEVPSPPIYPRRGEQGALQEVVVHGSCPKQKEIRGNKQIQNKKRNKTAPIKREKYLDELNWLDARTIFKLRTRMTNLLANFKGSHQSTECPRCNLMEETKMSDTS